jgi:DNA-binding transcriptional ArsR family regulator
VSRVEIRDLGEPEAVVTYPLGATYQVRLAGTVVSHHVLQPGWSWEAHAQPQVGTASCELYHRASSSATISELAEPFGMSLTGMKKHVRLLEEAELVTTEKVGRARRCTLVPCAFEGISTWLQRLDRFAQVVERTKGAR